MMRHVNKIWRDPKMKTGNVTVTPPQHNPYQNANKPDSNKGAGTPELILFRNPVDTYTPSVEGAANPSEINRLWEETNHAADAVRKLVSSMLGKEDAGGQGFWAIRAGGRFKLSEADRAQAQQLISEDGFFGVKQTTDRIMGFAKALVGENASEEQINNMRSAVQKGFDEVARLFGGFDKLPDVTKDTYNSIMQAFDNWQAGGTQEAA